MKKLTSVFSVLSLVSILAVPVSSFAQVSSSPAGGGGGGGGIAVPIPQGNAVALQAQIAALLAQIRQLQAQLGQAQGQQPAQFCFDWRRNLRIGDSGADVRALDQALLKEGIEGSQSFEGSRPTFISDDGVFIELTASAVSGFQEKYRSEILTPNGLARGTGYVGPSTRRKLNSLYGCSGTPTPTPIPVPLPHPTPPTPWPVPAAYQPLPTDPNISGDAYLVSANEDVTRKVFGQFDWSWKVTVKNGGTNPKAIKRMILVHNTPGEGWATDESVNNPVGKALYQLGTTVTSGCPVNREKCDLYYTSNLGAQIGVGETLTFYAYGDPGSWRFTGGYLLIEFTDNTSAQIPVPASDITPSDQTRPVVTEQVTCVFNGNGAATQSCKTADANAFGCSGVSSCDASVKGYSGSQITWKSTCGGYAYTTIDGFNEKAVFECSGSGPTQPSITVVSPNGGETFSMNDSITVRWTTTSPFGARAIDLKNMDTNSITTLFRVSNGQTGSGDTDGIYSFVPSQVSSVIPGHYMLSVYTAFGGSGDDTFDISNASFTIIGTTQNNSTLTAQRLFIGQYDNTKYSLTLSDPDGISEFLINKANGEFTWGGSPRNGTPPCPASINTGTQTYQPTDFPLTGTISDCKDPSVKYSIQLQIPSVPATQPSFSVGDRVQTTQTIDIRSGPSLTDQILGNQGKESAGAIVSGGTTAWGYTWWNVNFDSGADGWVIGSYLARAATVSAQSVNGNEMASILESMKLLLQQIGSSL